jgi:trimethylamine--corrinoid protein Co-methyltransferase
MTTTLQVLSQEEKTQIHERTLKILADTGVRVDTTRGRKILAKAGAEVDSSNTVRFPRALVEESLGLAPRELTLGARRPGWVLPLGAGGCTLCADGTAPFVLDWETGERRRGTVDDWLTVTRLCDALEEIGVYWRTIESVDRADTLVSQVDYWRTVFANFSKHVQDTMSTPQQAAWFLEVLQVVFGDKRTVQKRRPFSFLFCPESPLVIEETHMDAYLDLTGWEIPVAVMPMPLMGATAPASLISTVLQGNCEVLATLCLIQAAGPGTPVIYAPVLAVMNPRTGQYGAGGIENGLLGAASAEMARYYGLPAEATGFGTGHFAPSLQTGFERSLNALLPILAWPDILVGPGLLGGSTILSLDQFLFDVEVFRRGMQAHRGVLSSKDKWLDRVIEQVKPAGNFLAEPSTVEAIHDGEWYVSQVGDHNSYEAWVAAGRPRFIEEIREKTEELIHTHQPLPLGEEVERELSRIGKRAAKAEGER